MLEKLLLKNRSYRRFHQDEKISDSTLKKLVNYTRLCPSSGNFQPLKYYLSNTKENNEKIFSTVSWAGRLKNWNGPEEGEKPSAYIIILGDKNILKSFSIDPGIVAQTILLGAAESGLGGCMLGSIKKKILREKLSLSEQYEILLVVALGKPSEQVIIEETIEGKDVGYWRDEQDIHHVPKRKLEEIIVS